MPARRRAPGEGSYYKSSDGGYRGAVTLRQPDGSTVRRYVRGRSRRAVMDRAAALVARHHADAVAAVAPPSPPTLRDAIADWRRDVLPGLKRNTAASHDSPLRRLPAAVLDAPLDTGLAARLQAHYREMYAGGLAASTIQRYHTAVQAVLRLALARGQLTAMPAGISLPTPPRDGQRTLTADEARRLLASSAAANDPLLPLWALLAGTGMRLSEALGLRWQDIELDGPSPRLQVAGQLTSRGARVLAEPKSRRSRRVIPLVEPLLGILREARAVERPPHPWGLVLYRAEGGVWTQNVARSRFAAALARAGLPVVTPHGLRHTAATLLLEAGVSARVVADLLGHSNVAITLSTYSHVTDSLAREGAERLGQALQGPDAAGDAAGPAARAPI